MPDLQRHQGGCHCGKVRYEVETDLGKVVTCNCSICTKHGLLLTFVPRERFRLLSGAGDLREYLFNTNRIRHQFCTGCGVEPFAYGTVPGTDQEMVAVNVRCLDDVDPAGLTPTPFDGKRL
jgi:hypothetical protein